MGNSNVQSAEDRQSLDSLNSFNLNQPLSSRETGVSSIRNSKESLNSCGNDISFLGDKIRPEINNLISKEDPNNLDLQIKDSLKKLSEQFSKNPYENQNSLFNYYCTPFLNRNYNKKDEFFINNNSKETNESNNNLYKICPFDVCKDK